jgi:hypothetical protein
VRTIETDLADYRSIRLNAGEEAVYILRDATTGAVLKVGLVEAGGTRFSKYLTAANNLGRPLSLDIAVVTPHPGRTLVDVEGHLRSTLESEGHALPWDNESPRRGSPEGRLGRGGQGTPFVRKSGDPFLWTRDGTRIEFPETVARLRSEGLTDDQIVARLATETTTTAPTIRKELGRQASAIQAAEQAMLTPAE